MTIPKPCLACGTPTTNGSRCNDCEIEHQATRNAKRTHYKGDYKKRAKAVRDTAAICHICGEGPRYGDPFQADHLIPADPTSPLAPAHRTCNARRGNRPI